MKKTELSSQIEQNIRRKCPSYILNRMDSQNFFTKLSEKIDFFISNSPKNKESFNVFKTAVEKLLKEIFGEDTNQLEKEAEMFLKNIEILIGNEKNSERKNKYLMIKENIKRLQKVIKALNKCSSSIQNLVSKEIEKLLEKDKENG